MIIDQNLLTPILIGALLLMGLWAYAFGFYMAAVVHIKDTE
jgi:hypothetical protein